MSNGQHAGTRNVRRPRRRRTASQFLDQPVQGQPQQGDGAEVRQLPTGSTNGRGSGTTPRPAA